MKPRSLKTPLRVDVDSERLEQLELRISILESHVKALDELLELLRKEDDAL